MATGADNINIGLEIHVPLETGRKLFCDCPTNYAETEEANSLVCPVCTGMPGIKPAPMNKRALEAALTVAQLLKCKIVHDKIFMKRKHYNYPDLPKGYQITSEPLGVDGSFMDIGIWEAHIEEDPGQYTLNEGKVDYNRSGVPLLEIVTAPDMHSADEAREFMKELLKMLEYSGKIKKTHGIIRADVNVSTGKGNRVEIKNINSVTAAYKAIKLEAARQEKILAKGRSIAQETRGWVDDKNTTVLLRSKETAADYRYIPDPDLPPLELSKSYIATLAKDKPETPQEMRKRFISKYKISEKYAKVITIDKENAVFFEAAVAKGADSQLAARWLAEEVLAQLNLRGKAISDTKLSQKIFLELIALLEQGIITDAVAKKLLERVIDSGESPKAVVEKEKLGKVSDEGALGAAVDKIISANPGPVSDYRAGKKEAANFLMGQVMREMGGKADAGIVMKLLNERLA